MKGSRFILRPPKTGDEQAYIVHLNNYEVSKYLCQPPYPYTLEDGRQWIAQTETDESKHAFAIEMNGKVYGAIGLENIDQRNARAELGYWLAQELWGKGIIIEAIGIIADYGFNTLHLKRIYAKVFSFNTRSAKRLEKCGFLCEGLLRNDIIKNGQSIDNFLYSKVRD